MGGGGEIKASQIASIDVSSSSRVFASFTLRECIMRRRSRGSKRRGSCYLLIDDPTRGNVSRAKRARVRERANHRALEPADDPTELIAHHGTP